MLGTVGFAVAFVAGVMYLIQDGLLKSKRFNVLYSKLPALDFLDDLNQQSIVLGFPLLTLGIITGAISAEFARGTYVNWNPEQTWALVTWLFYFVVLVGRLTIGWRAKRAAYLTIICLLPEYLVSALQIPFYLGGTSLLIVVNVTMDTVTQIQSHLLAHQYGDLIKKAKLKGGRLR